MAEVLLPPDICPESETIELVDDGSVPFSPVQGKAVEQTQQYYEPRLRVVQRFRALRGSDKARMISALRRLSGRYGLLRAQVGRVQRGSFPATELLTNNTFADGTTGWTAANGVLTISDRVARLTATTPAASVQVYRTYTPPVANVPLAMRSMIVDGAQTPGLSIGPFLGAGNNGLNGYSTTRGLVKISAVCDDSGAQTAFPVVFGSSTNFTAGAYVDFPYTSLSRCMLVDNGANLHTYSDQFDNAAYTAANITVTANSVAAPDGNVTADRLAETAANVAHYLESTSGLTVPAAAADFSLSVALKSYGARQWAYILVSEGAGSSSMYQTFDLINGVKGTAMSAGANWSNVRTHITALGDGWYKCSITGRKTNAATTLKIAIAPSGGDNGTNFLGTATTGIYAWRATLAQSSVPTRLVQSTSAAVAASAQTGSALHVKGLPASTSGLLTADDVCEVNGELLQLTASLDSDAAGLGYLQFAPSLFRSPADNDPIIVNAPMPKMKLVGNAKWSNEWGVQSDLELTMDMIYE